jgi:tRNA(Leu) C34 or U34 (ribose-2'-O)-methylase TrmL
MTHNPFRSRAFSRRAVLRGAGCAMALPWMESVSALADTPKPSDFPKRFGVVFLGCGVHEDHWSAEGNGAAMKLSKSLSPLEKLKSKINVIDGLQVKALMNQGIHPAQTGSLLSGVPIAKGALIHSGISLDQMIANHVGQDTPQSSIVLACEQPMTGYHETNFSLAYSSHLSWQTPDSPVPVEVYPAQAWDSLFDNRGSLMNLSVLDRVNDRAKDLSRKISATDRGKLDEFMTSVREIERRMEVMRKGQSAAAETASLKNASLMTMDRPSNGLPEDLREHAKMMCDIIAIAFQTNKTRVASLIISRDLSAMYYPFLDVKDGHHSASHDNTSEGYERITRFHVEQYAYLASRLDSMKEGDGTVLDNSCLMFLSNMWIGRKHDNSRLPLVLAGGLGGTLETGRSLNYLNESEDKRKMCNLYLSLMDRYGVKAEAFGDSTTRLDRI